MSKMPPIPQEMQQQMSGSKPKPQGYVSADNKLTPEIVSYANRILHTQNLGYTEEKTINNTKFFFRCEPHYDNHVGGEYKWHKGVSVYTPKQHDVSSFPDKKIETKENVSKQLSEFIDKMKDAMEKEIKNLVG